MKGFYISVKNDLLEPKHVAQMGSSIWLYLWLLDKMTSVSEDGVGLILGGKPIKYAEVEDDLGMSDRTYRYWVGSLKEHGYISIKHAPHGIVFSVHKAKKRWSARNDRPAKSNRSAKNARPGRQDSAEQVGNKRRPNKTVSVDNTVDTSKEVAIAKVDKRNPEVQGVMDAFDSMGYKPPNQASQRRYAANLLRRDGATEVMANLRHYYRLRGEQYCPSITSPKDLWYKWDQLRMFLAKQGVEIAKKQERTEKLRKTFGGST